MKIYLFLLIPAFILFGCKKDKRTGAATKEYFMRATVNGILRECNAAVYSSYVNDIKTIAISGRWGTVTSSTDISKLAGIDILLSPYDKVAGEYIIIHSNQPGAYQLQFGAYLSFNNDDDSYATSTNNQGSGKLVVESFENDVVEGTFEFTAVNQKDELVKVEDGSFRIKIGETH